MRLTGRRLIEHGIAAPGQVHTFFMSASLSPILQSGHFGSPNPPLWARVSPAESFVGVPLVRFGFGALCAVRSSSLRPFATSRPAVHNSKAPKAARLVRRARRAVGLP
jgi:hypothetical protein